MANPDTVLLRHRGATFDEEVLGRVLAASTDLKAEIVIEPDATRRLDTLRHEYRRSGAIGLLDSLAYRVFYRLRLKEKETPKLDALVDEFVEQYADPSVPKYRVQDPNGDEMTAILADLEPEMMVARCKVLLSEAVFSSPTHGTFVIHPGICPEYRNQHGCFWALANGDDDRVGYSLIRIDEGIDTGDILAQDGTTFDPCNDEHAYIQQKVVADNVEEIVGTLDAVAEGEVEPIETRGRNSALWGMPKLSAWTTWKRRVRRFEIDQWNSSNQ
jgi:folate-dependent phosphoribosylglycinamide formyltransferase PurN